MKIGVEDALAEHLTDDHEEQVLGDLPARDLGQLSTTSGAWDSGAPSTRSMTRTNSPESSLYT
jgi:hypothetical protein